MKMLSLSLLVIGSSAFAGGEFSQDLGACRAKTITCSNAGGSQQSQSCGADEIRLTAATPAQEATINFQTQFTDIGINAQVYKVGGQIVWGKSPMGTLASVAAGYLTDLGSYTYTLVIPDLNMPAVLDHSQKGDVNQGQNKGDQSQVDQGQGYAQALPIVFDTVLIRTLDRSAAATKQALPVGALQESLYIPVTCTASEI